MEIDIDDDAPLNQKEAISTALALLEGEYVGDSDFDKAMRLLQEKLGYKNGSKHSD